MKNQVKKIESLIQKYQYFADEICWIDDNFWDAMHCDITGYWEQLDEDINFIKVETLENQVKYAEMLFLSLKNLKYIYG